MLSVPSLRQPDCARCTQQKPFILGMEYGMLTQRVRAHALWELGRRAEAVVELESVAAQGTEELLPLHSLLARPEQIPRPALCGAHS